MAGRLRRIGGTTVAGLVLGAGVSVASGGPAYAGPGGEIFVEGATLIYAASPGRVNSVDITYDETEEMFYVRDDATSLQAGTGCEPVEVDGMEQVACDAAGVTAITADAGDLADTLGVRGVMGAILTGGSGDDVIFGGNGADTLHGGTGSDSLNGGQGEDLLLGGAGPDTQAGGAGTDTVSYADHLAAVSADADGVVGDDGSVGENDTILPDVEKIIGGAADDLLLGGPGDDILDGGRGNDILVGGAGSDHLLGGPGYDVCRVGPQGGYYVSCEMQV